VKVVRQRRSLRLRVKPGSVSTSNISPSPHSTQHHDRSTTRPHYILLSFRPSVRLSLLLTESRRPMKCTSGWSTWLYQFKPGRNVATNQELAQLQVNKVHRIKTSMFMILWHPTDKLQWHLGFVVVQVVKRPKVKVKVNVKVTRSRILRPQCDVIYEPTTILKFTRWEPAQLRGKMSRRIVYTTMR